MKLSKPSLLYCILFLHQTTTVLCCSLHLLSCIASSFYIKPQPVYRANLRSFCCIASSFYIKPQQNWSKITSLQSCIASSFYIKPQRFVSGGPDGKGCIASSFYIKPQRIVHRKHLKNVVLHPLSTSNHNDIPYELVAPRLYCILFLHQTTTLDLSTERVALLYCILFLHQTTTCSARLFQSTQLYCILFLHQTTTTRMRQMFSLRLYCILFLHQTTTVAASPACVAGCIASSFYIKPQPRTPDTLIFRHLTASRHDTKRGGVHRGSRFDAVFTFSTNIRKIIFTEIRRCMSVQRAGARLRSDSSEANI